MPCCQYGPIAIVTGILAIAALGLTYSFGMGCAFISFAGGVNVSLSPIYTYIGPWSAQYTDFEGIGIDAGGGVTVYYSELCYTYKSFPSGPLIRDNFDAAAKTAQAFAIISMIMAPFLCLPITMTWCTTIRGEIQTFRKLAFLCFFTMFSSFMTLIFKASVLCNNCSYGWSAWICISAGVLWLFTGLGLLFIPKKS